MEINGEIKKCLYHGEIVDFIQVKKSDYDDLRARNEIIEGKLTEYMILTGNQKTELALAKAVCRAVENENNKDAFSWSEGDVDRLDDALAAWREASRP
jgi:hypothetical protein